MDAEVTIARSPQGERPVSFMDLRGFTLCGFLGALVWQQVWKVYPLIVCIDGLEKFVVC